MVFVFLCLSGIFLASKRLIVGLGVFLSSVVFWGVRGEFGGFEWCWLVLEGCSEGFNGCWLVLNGCCLVLRSLLRPWKSLHGSRWVICGSPRLFMLWTALHVPPPRSGRLSTSLHVSPLPGRLSTSLHVSPRPSTALHALHDSPRLSTALYGLPRISSPSPQPLGSSD